MAFITQHLQGSAEEVEERGIMTVVVAVHE